MCSRALAARLSAVLNSSRSFIEDLNLFEDFADLSAAI
jgi:hypothetical protein